MYFPILSRQNTKFIRRRAMNIFHVITKRRQNERSIKLRNVFFFLREAAPRYVIFLIQGCSFRVGSLFPGAERGEASAESRSRYDAGVRRCFIIAGFSKESSLADNTLFLTAR